MTTLEMIETGLHWLAAIAGLGTLAYSIANMLLAQTRPTGQQTGQAARMLRTPYLVIATILFILIAYLAWRPLPLHLSAKLSLALTILGLLVMLPSLASYIWGVRSLGRSFNVSSGFGVRLQQAHRLVMAGPFAYLRHPMYLGVILATWGGLLIYRTWSMLVCAIIMFGLVYRGKKEEEALALAFGPDWDSYKRRVPGWRPKLKRGMEK